MAAALEVMGISLAMSIITFGLPSLWSSCTPKPIDVSGWSDQEKVGWWIPALVSVETVDHQLHTYIHVHHSGDTSDAHTSALTAPRTVN